MLALDAVWLFILCFLVLMEEGFHSLPRSRDTTRHLRGHVPWRRCGISNRKTNVAAVIKLAPANPFMNGTPRHIFLPALLAATLAATAAAQQAKPIANWANLNQLVAGAEIRVTLATVRPCVDSCSGDSRVAGDQRDDQPGDALPARHPARRTQAAWRSRTKHAHRAGDWNGRRPGRGAAWMQSGPRQCSGLGKAVFTPLGAL